MDNHKHIGNAVEVIKGLVLGGIRDLDDILAFGIDVLIPLDHLDGSVWDTGFRGEILYCPITDYYVLPAAELDSLVQSIVSRLEQGKRVGMFCLGGNGRTGYVAACVLAALGVKEPIEYLRANYRREAVETSEQQAEIEHFVARNAHSNYGQAKVLHSAALSGRWCGGQRPLGVASGRLQNIIPRCS